ncbi:hypothetical protein LIER_38810 [Lithospermum erythrorhizon]|uniref:Uncharacterized protein n=1 Tax=Lithospermum erythrorhizon TaxID=34254 RepID=A0AAV3Q6Y7_LITER
MKKTSLLHFLSRMAENIKEELKILLLIFSSNSIHVLAGANVRFNLSWYGPTRGTTFEVLNDGIQRRLRERFGDRLPLTSLPHSLFNTRELREVPIKLQRKKLNPVNRVGQRCASKGVLTSTLIEAGVSGKRRLEEVDLLFRTDEWESRNWKNCCRQLEDEEGIDRDWINLGGVLVEVEDDGEEEMQSLDNNKWVEVADQIGPKLLDEDHYLELLEDRNSLTIHALKETCRLQNPNIIALFETKNKEKKLFVVKVLISVLLLIMLDCRVVFLLSFMGD